METRMVSHNFAICDRIVNSNRKELELVMRYIHEQGLPNRQLRVEEVFHPSTLERSET